MIDDMDYHIQAWYTILTGLGANLTMDRMKEESYGKNDEILERIFPGRFSAAEKARMSRQKEEVYQAEFKPQLQLIDGLQDFLDYYHKRGIKMTIGSAAIMFNVDFVLDGLYIRHYFDALVSADEVENSKPDPETFVNAAALLNIPASDCIVFEDNPNGVEAAERAGMKCVVITTMHKASDFSGAGNVLFTVEDYTDKKLYR